MIRFVALLALATGCSPGDSAPSDGRPATTTFSSVVLPNLPLPAGDDTTVDRVVDGDTIVTGIGTVRLIGIDTPESVHPTQTVECLGREAAAFTRALLPPGTAMRLVYDAGRTDRYGRTLAYVYRVEDGAFVNATIVAAGYAEVLTVPPNVAHAETFVTLAREARDAGLGLWQACASTTPTTALGIVDGCDPNYRGACVPPYPPDVDCADIGTRVEVVGPDPHRLDGDGDGFGCESN